MAENKLSKIYDYKCNICNKGYTSYQSLWNHNKKFHTNNSSNITQKPSKNTQISSNIPPLSSNNLINEEAKIICKYCNNIYSRKDNLKRHEQSCKEKTDQKLKEETKQKEIELLLKQQEEKIKKEEKEILKLKLKLENSDQIDNVTLKKLNKKLLQRQKLIKNSNVNSTVNSYNNTQTNIYNNFQLVGFGKEEVLELLTMSEKKQIMNARMGCLEKLIEIVHLNKIQKNFI
jgi:hypothetical protein